MTLKFNPLNLLVPLWLCHTAHCKGKIVSAHGFCVSRKGGIGRGGWVTYKVLYMHVSCMLHRLGCKRAMVGTGWASCNPGCMNKLRKHLQIVGGSFPAGKAASVLSECLSTENADYCMLVNEWAWSRSQVCFLRLKEHLFSVLESGLGQKWRYSVLKTCIC